MPERITDPKQTKVQLNVQVTWAFREQLREIADHRGVSLNALCVEALNRVPTKEDDQRATRKAGATK